MLEDWCFRLPMATAILTVLYPNEFTVYDTRVCAELRAFKNLGGVRPFDALRQGYEEFKGRVEEAAPDGLTLRDKDRYLWGKSLYQQLKADITRRFTDSMHGVLNDDPPITTTESGR